jgi:tartrate-resistant acid phosphatase type 5
MGKLAGIALLVFAPAALAQIDLGTVKGGDTVRLVAFGDFGDKGRGTAQMQVADGIAKVHAQTPFDLGLTFGDNFYPRGVRSVSDEKWQWAWEKPYARLKIPFYITLGNHDYDGNVQAQLDYAKTSDSFRLPATYYTFRAGPVLFVALDTNVWSQEQAAWLAGKLNGPPTPWTVVYAHHPVFSYGKHGDTRRLRDLHDLVKRRPGTIYMAGHEHEMQHLRRDGFDYVVCGAGGTDLRRTRKGPSTVWMASKHGFLEVGFSATEAQVRFRDKDAAILYEFERVVQTPAKATSTAFSGAARKPIRRGVAWPQAHGSVVMAPATPAASRSRL